MSTGTADHDPADTDPPALISVAEFRALMAEQHPFTPVLGIDVVAIGHGSATAFLPDQPAHQRLGGIVACPMLMALADVALYAAVVGATGNAGAVTTSLSINFMRGAPPGGVLAQARIHKTGRICSGDCMLLTTAQPPVHIAQAISTWALPGSRP